MYFYKRARYQKPRTCFWIKPFSKRFDVSILIFLDSPATRRRRKRGSFDELMFQSLFSWTLLQLNRLEQIEALVKGFNPYFPGLSCNKPFLRKKSFTKRTLFLLRKEYLSGEGIGNPNLFFWIKPFSKRFDVSILIFLDSPATLKILLHSHFLVCSHPIYIFRYAWLLMINNIYYGAHQPNII